jgi:Cu(I)/Ag(I) efflux system membrane fusion protein
MYVETGTQIYTVRICPRFRSSSMLDRTCPGSLQAKVQFDRGYHGETFVGQISFIDPVLDPMTRTVKVRVEVPNAAGRLKPEMFVRAGVQVQMARDGQVVDPNLAGKWISPMHPSVVKSGPGTCDICGMDLVPAESLGYVTGAPARRRWSFPRRPR